MKTKVPIVTKQSILVQKDGLFGHYRDLDENYIIMENQYNYCLFQNTRHLSNSKFAILVK